jgi:lipopolysaccharide/colanic/teichoic acid biosynthesis glycosyltransferase
VTRGRNRVMSRAEVLGRLSFCGYKVIAEKTFGSTLYFIAQKLSTVSTEEAPSYGPIVRLKRVGLDGNIITIHKFRTMYPYSEFIQKETVENHSLNPSGKIKNDFRVTSWGKIIRSLFIDELPQFYDWFQGKVKLVGVRALSEHYFSLYPVDLQKERIKQKPGLVPPYYADMPQSFEEIVDSELKYLARRAEKPLVTDVVYLYKGLVNIVFRGARSS